MKNKTAVWAIFVMLLCTLFTSAGQLFFKLGSETASFDLALLTNYNLIIGLILYGAGALLLIISLKGGELSVLYPIIATSYIWVSLIAWRYFNEPISSFKILGIMSIILGVSFVGRGSKND